MFLSFAAQRRQGRLPVGGSEDRTTAEGMRRPGNGSHLGGRFPIPLDVRGLLRPVPVAVQARPNRRLEREGHVRQHCAQLVNRPGQVPAGQHADLLPRWSSRLSGTVAKRSAQEAHHQGAIADKEIYLPQQISATEAHGSGAAETRPRHAGQEVRFIWKVCDF